MIQTFDIYDLYETPTFILCNPDKTQLFSLGAIRDRKFSPRFNSLSELSFTAPASIQSSSSGSIIDMPYYNFLSYRRLILLTSGSTEIGYFMITSVEENNDGIVKEKYITAQSLEVEMVTKTLSDFTGTYKFYDITGGSSTLLGYLLNYLPGWSIGTVDATLMNLYRTFDITENTFYNFLMQDVETAYQCIFVFDTVNQTISAYDATTYGTTTDVYISYDNLITNAKIEEKTDQLVTALTVKGAGDLSINTVNPLGTNVIYNFDYFKNTNWMSQTLINKLDNWESMVSGSQALYANLLTSLKDTNGSLITQESELVTLNDELTSLIGVRDVQIQQGLDLTAINILIDNKNIEILSKQSQINSSGSLITNIQSQLTAINNALCFDCNFTTSELEQLSRYTLESGYTNDNFIQTDIMSNVEIQEQAQELYDQAIVVLNKISQPRYMITMDLANFILLKEYLPFTNQTEMGTVFNLNVSGSTVIQPMLLGLDINYDNPTDFTLTFSNRTRLSDGSFDWTDLNSDAIKQSRTTKVDSTLWTERGNYTADTVTVALNSAWDAGVNAVISGSNQQIRLDSTGLWGRQIDPLTGTYSLKQFKMINNVWAFTDDNWASSKLVLGEIYYGSGSAYGLAAQVLIGNLIAGNQLTISNSNNNFLLDSSGAFLTNATFTLNTTNGNSKILLDPTNAIKIQQNVGGTWTDRFAADNTGNITFSGVLSGATGTFSGGVTATYGTIGGLNISSSGIAYDSDHYIASNGDLVWGNLSIVGSTASFDGTIYADNINGTVASNQIADTLSGKTLTWAGGYIGVDGNGNPVVYSYSSLGLGLYNSPNIILTRTQNRFQQPSYFVDDVTASNNLYVSGGTFLNTLQVNSTLYVGNSSSFNGRVYFNGGITSNGNSSFTGTLSARNYDGRILYIYFNYGICTGYGLS